MADIISIEYGSTYHIYHRGVNSCTLFQDEGNFRYFLKLYSKYIPQVADTYAWILMGNHFHFLLRIKKECEILPFPPLQPPLGSANSKGVPLPTRKPVPSHQLSHLFNSYAQAFNKRKNRTGHLFECPFHRKKVESREYFMNLALYIHTNPRHHKFNIPFSEYLWSSYTDILKTYHENPSYHEVIQAFGS